MPRTDIMLRNSRSLIVAALLLAIGAVSVRAQGGGAAACKTGRIEHIFVDNHSIFDTSDPELDPRFRWAYSLANELHVRTDEAVIRRELLFDVGDCYDPVLMEESERLLRGYPFIARADIYGVRQPGGALHVVVDTEDEWSTQVETRLDLSQGFDFQGVDVREQNLLGTGRELGVFYSNLDATQTYGVRYFAPQLFRTRWNLDLAGGKTRAGTFLDEIVSYPFVGEIGRWAAQQRLYRHDRYFDYLLPSQAGDELRLLVPLREKEFQLALLRRFGRVGNLTILGAGMGFQEISYPGSDSTLSLVRNGDYRHASPAPGTVAAPALGAMEHLRNIRAMILLGKRNIVWRQRRGLDSFRGEEDVRIGADVEIAFARSLPGLESDNDLYGSLDFYAAAGPPTAFMATRIRADARRDYAATPGTREVKDLIAESETFLYVRPSQASRHTLVLRAAAAGGWHTATPFQITLGGQHSLRGLPRTAFPGGRRVVFTAEDRFYVGWPLTDVADFGTSLFVDVGRIWPGDAPYGQSSGWRTSVGGGIRANFPAGGTNTFRVDAAFPVGSNGGLGKLQLLIGVTEYLGISSRFEDPQLSRSRVPPIRGNLLSFPN